MNEVGAEMGTTRQQLADDFHALAAHAEALVRATAAVSGDTVSAAREKLIGSVMRVRDQLKSAQGFALDTTREAARATDSYVHQKPWQVIGAALLVGIVIGAAAASGRR